MKRPLIDRIWFYRPFTLTSWRPVWRGGDEFEWHTVIVGLPFIGWLCVATKPCPQTGRCADMAEEYIPEWPVDVNGHNHVMCDTDCWVCEPEEEENG